MAESINNVIYKIEVDTKTGQVNIDGLTKGFVQADKAVLKLQKDISKTTAPATKSMKGLGDATGSATSATMELSRVISDAPYGIRGMANNITQLVSQMGTASVKAGGLGAAMKLMWKQMLGPLGIVFAITAVVSALDYFQGGAKKAAGAGKEFELSAKDLSSTLRDLYDTQGDVNGKIDEYIDLVMRKRVIAKEDAETNKEIAKFDKIIDDAKDLMFRNDVERLGGTKRLSKEQIAFASEIYEAQKKILEQAELDRVNAFKKSIKNQEELNTLTLNLNAAEEGTLKSLKTQLKLMEKRRELTAKDKEDYDKQTLAIKAQQKLIEEIEGAKTKIAKKKKRAKVTAFDTSSIEKDAKKYVDEVMKMEKKNALLLAGNNVDKLIIEREFQLNRISRLKGDNSALMAEYTKYYDTLIKTAEEKLLGKSQIDPFAPRDLNDDAEKIKERQRLLTEVKLQALADSAEAVTGFLNGEFQRELDMEQNKTNALNNELNKRLLNENLSKDERKRIQLQIGANDEKLRIKQEQIEKKRFKLNKAANIAQATIATYLAAAQVMANPLDLNPVTKGIAMASTIAMGLANVATIARQKFQSSAGSGGQIGGGFGGGSGSGGNDRDFNFNLAGTSQQNQLAQTLQGQFSQPIQAYVVSTDMTNQQQLDQEILGNATFG